MYGVFDTCQGDPVEILEEGLEDWTADEIAGQGICARDSGILLNEERFDDYD